MKSRELLDSWEDMTKVERLAYTAEVVKPTDIMGFEELIKALNDRISNNMSDDWNDRFNEMEDTEELRYFRITYEKLMNHSNLYQYKKIE